LIFENPKCSGQLLRIERFKALGFEPIAEKFSIDGVIFHDQNAMLHGNS
jgi:hypothetical protein